MTEYATYKSRPDLFTKDCAVEIEIFGKWVPATFISKEDPNTRHASGPAHNLVSVMCEGRRQISYDETTRVIVPPAGGGVPPEVPIGE